MLLFRSLAIGLLSACFVLLLMKPRIEVRMVQPAAQLITRPAPVVPTIIDVAPGVSTAQLAAMIRLAPGEHVTSIDDAEVAGDVSAGVALASVQLQSKQFIDVGVNGPDGERRVLVLLH